MKKLALWRTLVCLAPALLLLCNGGGTETSNGKLTVSVTDNRIEVLGRTHLMVSVFDTGYLAFIAHGFTAGSSTDSIGRASFGPLADGVYNVFIQDNAEKTIGHIAGLRVPSDVSSELTLSAPGKLAGVVRDSTGRVPLPSYVFIPGSPYYSMTGSDGAFALDSVAEGSYWVRIWTPTTDTSGGQRAQKHAFSVDVESSGFTNLDTIIVGPVP